MVLIFLSFIRMWEAWLKVENRSLDFSDGFRIVIWLISRFIRLKNCLFSQNLYSCIYIFYFFIRILEYNYYYENYIA
jgi:hypothetical protein